MINYIELEKELRKIITPESVFVCIGSSKVSYDIFGPYCGTLLKKNKVPYYGDMRNTVNAVNMYDKLDLIYDNHDNTNIIAIDACVTRDKNKLGEVKVRTESGIRPAAGVGGRFPEVGYSSIIMYTITFDGLKDSFVKGGVINEHIIKRQAKLAVNLISKIYNEVLEGVII